MSWLSRWQQSLDPDPDPSPDLPSAPPRIVQNPDPGLVVSDARLWISARLDGEQLRLSVGGCENYDPGRPDGSLTDVAIQVDLTDAAALRSARALVASIPDLDEAASAEVGAALAAVLETYRGSMTRLTRRAAREAEAAAYRLNAPGTIPQEVSP